ncbi:CDP-glycerol glycerophosphotransferase family protein [Grimontia hollisae]|uniref:CDP-glycerol glycerophosphotransferase family protein n=1 Tax=Grimontia hollisae TaxID=673 RepID=UPI002114135F|nr:CDP-glycerol glycerophosphotransferase family protein [Grimontia hollisae]
MNAVKLCTLFIIDLFVTKNKKYITLYTSTNVLDANLLCINSYISFYHKNHVVKCLKNNEVTITKNGLICLFHMMRSHVIIVDHTIPRYISSCNRKIYNTWHGIPVKNIRYLDSSRFNISFLKREARKLDGLVCSSELDRAVMSACFQVEPNKCIISGLPRNDILLSEKLEWFDDPQEKTLIEKIAGRTVISWMPTYRGNWYENNEVAPFNLYEESRLSEILSKNNAVLIVRPHKFSKIQSLNILNSREQIIEGGEFTITNTILKHTDILITDYSSVWIDYSLISERIILFTYDKDEYEDERGTIYPIKSIFKGKIASDCDSLFFQLKYYFDNLSFKDINNDRNDNKLFFKFNDSNNTRRLINEILSST